MAAHTMKHGLASLGYAALLALPLATTVEARRPKKHDVAPAGADADADGVADDLDQCPETASDELVGSDGCPVCACGAGWSSHEAYVACVSSEARRQRMAGTLRVRAARAATRMARISTCGNEELTRCCVYAGFDSETGRCRLMTPHACDALDESESVDSADDEGPGSCLPNPCSF